jgi:protein subunit release factor A
LESEGGKEMKELLFRMTAKDFDVQFFCAGGHGGQNMQKNATACRIVHPESGAVGISRDERSQLQNKKKAFQRMMDTKEFKQWHKIKCAKMMGQGVDIETWVSDQMKPENLKIEEITI